MSDDKEAAFRVICEQYWMLWQKRSYKTDHLTAYFCHWHIQIYRRQRDMMRAGQECVCQWSAAELMLRIDENTRAVMQNGVSKNLIKIAVPRAFFAKAVQRRGDFVFCIQDKLRFSGHWITNENIRADADRLDMVRWSVWNSKRGLGPYKLARSVVTAKQGSHIILKQLLHIYEERAVWDGTRAESSVQVLKKKAAECVRCPIAVVQAMVMDRLCASAQVDTLEEAQGS